MSKEEFDNYNCTRGEIGLFFEINLLKKSVNSIEMKLLLEINLLKDRIAFLENINSKKEVSYNHSLKESITDVLIKYENHEINPITIGSITYSLLKMLKKRN